jgi:SH3-like domain-containing protein
MTTRFQAHMAARWLVVMAAVALALDLFSGLPLRAQSGTGALPQPYGVGATGLPLPRFVSLKADRVQIRQGPGTDHKVLWVFSRVGLPVEVIQEFENWRQVRDQDGSVGWVAHTLLSARRTAVVLAWATGEQKGDAPKTVALRREASASSATVALLEPGVVCDIRTCDGQWCQISVGDYRGFIEQDKLWGVYPNEAVK